MAKNKVLIIRFSSFGDIVQCSAVVEPIAQELKDVEIHWATRKDFDYLLKLNQKINYVWSLDKKLGIIGLIKFAFRLRSEKFTHIYDAHNNLRSLVLKLFLKLRWNSPQLITRSKYRIKRILLFSFGINKFNKPFKGIDSFRDPLLKWGIKSNASLESRMVNWNFSDDVKFKINNLIGLEPIIALVPSAAWEMKRWPIEHWKQLISLLPKMKFVVLGGSEDLFCQDFENLDPNRILNLAGKLSLVESCYLVTQCTLIISADTGLLHVADVLGVRGLSLMGPTAFGFTKSPLVKTLEIDLPCRPCSKDGSGRCSQPIYQRCMVDITPTMVASEVQSLSRE